MGKNYLSWEIVSKVLTFAYLFQFFLFSSVAQNVFLDHTNILFWVLLMVISNMIQTVSMSDKVLIMLLKLIFISLP